MIVWMLFILDAIGFYLYMPVSSLQAKVQELNRYCRPNKIPGSQYRKKLSIWELGKNKFT
jgi:hypothetical protein